MRHMLPFQYIEAITRAGSIRKAADVLAITPSALNRRLLSIEEELGVPIFERLATGVRLNTAGEILLEHIRTQMSDLERVKSRISDLAGMRAGNVSIACTPDIMGNFLIEEIDRYQQEFPGVSFKVDQYFRGDAEVALSEHMADIALVFEPLKLADFQIVLSMQLEVHCIMQENHPLAESDTLRLYECAEYPLVWPSESWGLRQLLEQSGVRLGIAFHGAVESNSREFIESYPLEGGRIAFELGLILPSALENRGLIARPVNMGDLSGGFLFVGHLRGRALPVAAARFLEQLTASLAIQLG